MSASMKGKYEVLKLVRDNILLGLQHFGITVGTPNPSTEVWNCLEYDQASFKNYDHVVLVRYANATRIGWQFQTFKAQENLKYLQSDTWIEQQEWEIQAVTKRRTTAVTANTITTEDVANMLIAWFNGDGLAQFRLSGCGSLPIRESVVRTYKGGSDVPQFRSVFTLKLQVPKTFRSEIDSALVKFEGAVGV